MVNGLPDEVKLAAARARWGAAAVNSRGVKTASGARVPLARYLRVGWYFDRRLKPVTLKGAKHGGK
jgi:hypothetical protein